MTSSPEENGRNSLNAFFSAQFLPASLTTRARAKRREGEREREREREISVSCYRTNGRVNEQTVPPYDKSEKIAEINHFCEINMRMDKQTYGHKKKRDGHTILYFRLTNVQGRNKEL